MKWNISFVKGWLKIKAQEYGLPVREFVEEYLTVGMAGLVKGAEKFDVSHFTQVKFVGYAKFWIKKLVLKELREELMFSGSEVSQLKGLVKVERKFFRSRMKYPNSYYQVIQFDSKIAQIISEEEYDYLIRRRREVFSMDTSGPEEESMHKFLSGSEEQQLRGDEDEDEFDFYYQVFKRLKVKVKGSTDKIKARNFLIMQLSAGYDYEKRELQNELTDVEIGKKFSIERARVGQIKQENEKVLKKIILEVGTDMRGVSSSGIAKKGGIDFNSDNLNIETRGRGIDFNAPIDPQLLESLMSSPIEGFMPVILNISPVKNLNLFLGLKQEAEEGAVDFDLSSRNILYIKELDALELFNSLNELSLFIA